MSEYSDLRWVENAIVRVNGLYRMAGPHVEANRLAVLSPKEQANAAWARLREAGVDSRLPIAAWLAVEMVIEGDPEIGSHRIAFMRVQGAKIVHRLASGTHRAWKKHQVQRVR